MMIFKVVKLPQRKESEIAKHHEVSIQKLEVKVLSQMQRAQILLTCENAIYVCRERRVTSDQRRYISIG